MMQQTLDPLLLNLLAIEVMAVGEGQLAKMARLYNLNEATMKLAAHGQVLA